MLKPHSGILAAGLLVALVSGVAASVAAEAHGIGEAAADIEGCAERCTGDEADGDCSAGCDDCGCCAGLAAAAALPTSGASFRAAASEAAVAHPAAFSDGITAQVFRPPRSARS